MGWADPGALAFSGPCLRRLAWRCLLEASPREVAFHGVLGLVLVHGYAEEDVTPLRLVVLGCLRTPQYFSDFG